MHFGQLDLNLLVSLDALLTERNITEAGRRVYLTQSAMSGALARLREYFGDELLIQVGRKMVPTPLAESLAGPVREILLKIKSTVHVKPAFDPAQSSRRFSLMMSDYVSTVLMPEVLRRAEAIAPHITFDVQSNDVANPFETLDRADVDFLIMPQHFLAAEHPNVLLYRDGYVCMVWVDNPLVGDSLSAEEYLALGHVVLQYRRTRTAFIDDWFFTKLGVTRRAEVFVSNFNAVPQLVIGTRRVVTIQRRLATYYARHFPLRMLPPPFELPELNEAAQWHRQFDEDPGNRWLCELLIESAQQVQPC